MLYPVLQATASIIVLSYWVMMVLGIPALVGYLVTALLTVDTPRSKIGKVYNTVIAVWMVFVAIAASELIFDSTFDGFYKAFTIIWEASQ